MTYGTKYRVEFQSLGSTVDNFRVNIKQKDFGGSVTELTGTENPCEIQYMGDTASPKTSQIIASSCTVSVRIKQDDNFDFRELFAAEDREFFVSVEQFASNTWNEIWSGYFVPSLHSERYTDKPHTVELNAIDGIGLLETEYLSSYSGRERIAVVIHEILSKLGEAYSGNIWYRILSWSAQMSSGDNPLWEAFVEKGNYTKKTADNPENDDLNCLQILKEILKSFNLQIIKAQFGDLSLLLPLTADYMIYETSSRWNNQNSQTWLRTLNGAVGASYTVDVRLPIGQNTLDRSTLFPLFSDQELNMLDALKEVEFEFKSMHVFNKNQVINGAWRYFTGNANDAIVNNWTQSDDFKAKIMSGSSTEWASNRLVIVGDNEFPDNPRFNDENERIISDAFAVTPAIDYRFRLVFQTQIPAISGGTANSHANLITYPKFQFRIRWSDGADFRDLVWTPANSHHFFDVNVAKRLGSTHNSTEQRTISIDLTPPGTGTLQITIFGVEAANWSVQEFDQTLGRFVGTNGTYRGAYIVSQITLFPVNDIDLDFFNRRLVDESDIDSGKGRHKETVIHVDDVANISTGVITTAAGGATSGWKRVAADEGVDIIEHSVRMLLNLHRIPVQKYQGTIWTADKMKFWHINSIVEPLQGGGQIMRFFMPVEGKFNLRDSSFTGTLIHIINYDPDHVINRIKNEVTHNPGSAISNSNSLPGNQGDPDNTGVAWHAPDGYDVPGFITPYIEGNHSSFENGQLTGFIDNSDGGEGWEDSIEVLANHANVFANTTDDNDVTVTLQANPSEGQTHTIIKIGAGNTVTIETADDNTINGENTYVLNANYETVTVRFIQGEWIII